MEEDAASLSRPGTEKLPGSIAGRGGSRMIRRGILVDADDDDAGARAAAEVDDDGVRAAPHVHSSSHTTHTPASSGEGAGTAAIKL